MWKCSICSEPTHSTKAPRKGRFFSGDCGCAVSRNRRRGCGKRGGRDESRPYRGLQPPHPMKNRAVLFVQSSSPASVRVRLWRAAVFVRAAFPLARCRRGLIYQAQNGCGCAVADDGSQRDAPCRGMGDGDAGNAAGAINCAPTVRLCRNRRFFVRAAFPCARCR